MNKKYPALAVICIGLFLSSCGKTEMNEKEEWMQSKIDKFATVEVRYDEGLLDPKQKIIVAKLYEAAKIIDELFLEQVYADNPEIKKKLEGSTEEYDKLVLKYFDIMFGPFDRLDHNKPFIRASEKPLGANFYPEDLSKDEFEKWIKDRPADEEAFTSEFTVIRRQNGGLAAIPYSEYYKTKLLRISSLLKEAAANADNKTLKNYLLRRAEAFLSNDYYQSDMAWMDLKDHVIEVVIGPYEVYEDALFNYKAAFECFLTIVDPVETRKLEKFAGYISKMEENLPIAPEHKNYKRGSESPIVVVQQIFSAGDAKAGIQTLAFNLPNDERVRKAKGSKKVMLKNIHEAKFSKILKPIANLVLHPSEIGYVTFEGFFNHTLMHELSHGIGPGQITVNGKTTEVKKQLKDTYSKIEECKADVLGLLNNILLIREGLYPGEMEKQFYATFLAGIFRSVRFGITEAHGAANAVIYNFLLEKGAFDYNQNTVNVRVNYEKMYPSLRELAAEILRIQATGDYDRAVDFINRFGFQSISMKALTAKLESIPVDIKPVYAIDRYGLD